MNTMETSEQFLMKTYGRQPIAVQSGIRGVCTDETGKTYIDFGSGIGTNSLGYCDADWADAVYKQVRTVQHTSNYYYVSVQAELAEQLCTLTDMERVFFGNSGAEANECAIKVARKYSFDRYGEGRGTILTLQNSFHGRTLTTLAATGQDVFHKDFHPFPQGFVHAKPNDLTDLHEKLDDSVCAVMIELVQGEGGVHVLDPDYVKVVAELCQERDLLLIVDEVQTGIGRTGTFLACEQYRLHPDIITLAKGLGGGLPIGACLVAASCADVMGQGSHGSTFGGNPVVCAGALAVLSRVAEPGFLDSVQEKSVYIREVLESCPEVESVSGLGLMIGIRLKTMSAGEILAAAREAGLLVLTAKDKVRLLPPLTISKEELDAGLEILLQILNN
ncbi:MAG: aspartate aminotransferase family protein [Oscillospiraceae bacterium]|nr:aspartate aminotransferase family protein [Oscillospiraceae bacterium]